MGVKLIGREIYVQRGARVAAGAALHSPCHILGQSSIGGGCTLLPGCCVCGSVVEGGCTLGPYANVRAGCTIGGGCRVGDFVELKNATLGRGCRAAHLAYIGDAQLGERVNVGCGVVFANYNGRTKERTYVGDGAFIGCNSVIVAPARIGAGAYVAAATVVGGGNIPPKALAISRPQLVIKPNAALGRYLN